MMTVVGDRSRMLKFAVLGMIVVAVAALGAPGEASAQWGAGYGYNTYRGYGQSYGYNGPIYHAPSVHYDRVYHPTTSHWTPWRGWHTHGHYDYVPHYTPGHYDYHHGNHIDANPHFHHR